jgi:HEAT repeat protein
VEVVKAALAVLGDRWSPLVASQVLACLEHPARDVRRLVADLLGVRAERSSLDPLRRLLSTERDPLVREALEAAALQIEAQVLPVRWTTPVPPRRSEPATRRSEPPR